VFGKKGQRARTLNICLAEEESSCVPVSAGIGPLAAERPITLTILDMMKAGGGREKRMGRPPSSGEKHCHAWVRPGGWYQHPAEEEDRCVLITACVGPLAAERPETIRMADMVRAGGEARRAWYVRHSAGNIVAHS
jgi:hypothetical protein